MDTEKQNQTPVLVSTDIGSDIDDALAIQAMFNSGINLQGIYTVNGDVNFRSYIAKHMVNLANREIPVYTGESKSLTGKVKPYTHFEDCHVDDCFVDHEDFLGESDIRYISLPKAGIKQAGVKNLAAKLDQEPQVVLSLAPLTNIARLLKQHPQSARNIQRLYIMGSRLSGDLEHNFIFDPEAAKSVLESDLPITVVPGDVCSRYKMPVQTLDQLSSPSGEYVRKMALGFTAVKTAMGFNKHIEELDNATLNQIFEEHIKINPKAARELGPKSFDLQTTLQRLVVNLNDPIFGAFDGPGYFRQFNALLDFLKQNQDYFNHASEVIPFFGDLIPTTLSVADVYVPYCLLHPEKLTTKQGIVECLTKDKSQAIFGGESRFTEGSKHEIVTDLDFDDFERFIGENLR